MANAKCLVTQLMHGKRGDYKICWIQINGSVLPMKINCNIENAPSQGEDCTVYLLPDYRGFARPFVRKEEHEDA